MAKSISALISGKPYSQAKIKGKPIAPKINGTVKFYPWAQGTIVKAEIVNLPLQRLAMGNISPIGPFGFHLHSGKSCDAPDGHYNPTATLHPNHAGDMPVLFSNNGYSFMVFYTDRFTPAEAIGKTVVIHQNPDDYRTQPAGNSGEIIACGEVVRAS